MSLHGWKAFIIVCHYTLTTEDHFSSSLHWICHCCAVVSFLLTGREGACEPGEIFIQMKREGVRGHVSLLRWKAFTIVFSYATSYQELKSYHIIFSVLDVLFAVMVISLLLGGREHVSLHGWEKPLFREGGRE